MLNEKLQGIIRKKVTEELNRLEEMSTTGDVAGYLTPGAFAGDKHSIAGRVEKMAKSIGYSLTKKGREDTRPGDTLVEGTYYEYRDDTSKLPHQKIGTAISEVNKQIKIIERVLRLNGRLKKESGVTNEALWKRTKHQMTKLEAKLVELAGQLREMRS